jgi:hypothetical protein
MGPWARRPARCGCSIAPKLQSERSTP